MKVRPFSEVADLMVGKQGWQQGTGDVVFQNPKLGQVLHVAMCKDDGTPMWDQFIHVEPLGAVTVPVNKKGEFGLVKVDRPTVKSPEQYRYPELNLADLGVSSLETPRGFPKKGEAGAQTAHREGEEELGSPIELVKKIGEITPNTTFHPHRIPVYFALVNHEFAGTAPPDVNEKILKVEWVSTEDLNRRIAAGEINCAMTLAALQLFAAYHAQVRAAQKTA